jgi:hypothetical protein
MDSGNDRKSQDFSRQKEGKAENVERQDDENDRSVISDKETIKVMPPRSFD